MGDAHVAHDLGAMSAARARADPRTLFLATRVMLLVPFLPPGGDRVLRAGGGRVCPRPSSSDWPTGSAMRTNAKDARTRPSLPRCGDHRRDHGPRAPASPRGRSAGPRRDRRAPVSAHRPPSMARCLGSRASCGRRRLGRHRRRVRPHPRRGPTEPMATALARPPGIGSCSGASAAIVAASGNTLTGWSPKPLRASPCSATRRAATVSRPRRSPVGQALHEKPARHRRRAPES